MTSLAVDAHAAAARLDIHELVRQLNGHLGPTLVAALAGTPDRRCRFGGRRRPARRRGPAISGGCSSHRLWTPIAGQESDQVARSWFIAGNPLLDEDTPITAIREDRGKDVVAAVEAFIEDQPAT